MKREITIMGIIGLCNTLQGLALTAQGQFVMPNDQDSFGLWLDLEDVSQILRKEILEYVKQERAKNDNA